MEDIRNFSFDPACDLQEVDQFGFIDLRSAFERGIIPGDLTFQDEQFNGVDNPGVLMHRSQDVFESLRQVNYVREKMSDLNAREKEAAEKQVESVTEKSGV